MAIERDGDGDALVQAGVFNRLPNDLLMAEVDAVEHPDGDADLARAVLQVSSLGNSVHVSQREPWRTLSRAPKEKKARIGVEQ